MTYRSRRAKTTYKPRRKFRQSFLQNIQPALKRVSALGKKGWLIDTATKAIPKSEAEELVKQRDYSDARYIRVAKYDGRDIVFLVHKPTREEIRRQQERERWEREWKAKTKWRNKHGTEFPFKVSGRGEPKFPHTLPLLLGRDSEGKRYVLDRGQVWPAGKRYDWAHRWQGLKVNIIRKKHRVPEKSPGINDFLESPDYPQSIRDSTRQFKQYDYKKAKIEPYQTFLKEQQAKDLVQKVEKTGAIPARYTYGISSKGKVILVDWNKPDPNALRKILKGKGFDHVDEVTFTDVDAPFATYDLEEES